MSEPKDQGDDPVHGDGSVYADAGHPADDEAANPALPAHDAAPSSARRRREPRRGPELTVEKAQAVAEQAIRQGQREGEFDDLPGTGRRSARVDAPYDPNWWVTDKMRREQLDLVDALPEVMRLRRERPTLPEVIRPMRDEDAVRARLRDYNDRVLADRRQPVKGPTSPPVAALVDIEELVAQWRTERRAIETAEAETAAERARQEAADVEARRARRRWWAPWRW